MAETTLKECCAAPHKRRRLPDAPGIWIRRVRESGRICDELCPVDRDAGGDLVWFYNGRPVMSYDRGSYIGPFRLTPAATPSSPGALAR